MTDTGSCRRIALSAGLLAQEHLVVEQPYLEYPGVNDLCWPSMSVRTTASPSGMILATSSMTSFSSTSPSMYTLSSTFPSLPETWIDYRLSYRLPG